MLVVGGHCEEPQDTKAANMGSYLARTGPLPSMPKIAERMMALLQDPNVNQGQLASLIEMDPGVSAQIMRIVNSALYGLPRRVVDLRHGISMIGLNEIRNLVIATASRSVYKKFGPTEQKMWEHSMRSAIVARMVAMSLTPAHRDVSFLAGQMHDVGTVLLQSHSPELQVRSASSDEDGDRAQEFDTFGFSHSDVGALLMNQWNMPREVEAACFYHHDMDLVASLEPDLVDILAVTVIADCVTREEGVEHHSKQLVSALEVLELTTKRFAALCDLWRAQAFSDSALFGT